MAAGRKSTSTRLPTGLHFLLQMKVTLHMTRTAWTIKAPVRRSTPSRKTRLVRQPAHSRQLFTATSIAQWRRRASVVASRILATFRLGGGESIDNDCGACDSVKSQEHPPDDKVQINVEIISNQLWRADSELGRYEAIRQRHRHEGRTSFRILERCQAGHVVFL